MDELPYMVVCLAEVCNNVGWKPTRRHRHIDTSAHIQQTPFEQMMQINDISILINLSDIFDLSIQR